MLPEPDQGEDDMGYNPGVERVGPLEVGRLLQADEQFRQKLPIDRMQAASYSRQVGVQEKEQEEKRKDMLRQLKEEYDKHRGLAVALGMPKELADASSVGELRGFNEKAVVEFQQKQKMMRSPEEVNRDVEATALDRTQREDLGKIGQQMDVGGVPFVRTGPGRIERRDPDTSRQDALLLREKTQLMSALSAMEKGISGMPVRFEDMDPVKQQRYLAIKGRLTELGALPEVLAGEDRQQGAAAGTGPVGAAARPGGAAEGESWRDKMKRLGASGMK
jgi:hypothetical protein